MLEKTKVRGIALDESARFREAGLGRLLNESGLEKEGLLLSERSVLQEREVQQTQCVWKEKEISAYLEWGQQEEKEKEAPEHPVDHMEENSPSGLTALLAHFQLQMPLQQKREQEDITQRLCQILEMCMESVMRFYELYPEESARLTSRSHQAFARCVSVRQVLEVLLRGDPEFLNVAETKEGLRRHHEAVIIQRMKQKQLMPEVLEKQLSKPKWIGRDKALWVAYVSLCNQLQKEGALQ